MKKRALGKFPNHDSKKPPKLCSKIGCKALATSAIRICVPAVGWPIGSHAPLQLITIIKACATCLEVTDCQEMLNEDIRAIFVHICRSEGKAPPDFTRAWLEPVALDSEAYLDFERKTANYKLH